jgi:hypothetical protein
MNLKLGAEQVQDAIKHFMEEAKQAAQTGRPVENKSGLPGEGVLGYAAMLTALSCLVAVGECMKGGGGIEQQVEIFHVHMIDKSSWLIPPEGITPNDKEVQKKLKEIRNSLAHCLAGPYDVILLPNRESDIEYSKKYANHTKRWRIIVPEFIEAVKETIDKVSDDGQYRDNDWNPTRQDESTRAMADVSIPHVSPEESTGGSCGSPFSTKIRK